MSRVIYLTHPQVLIDPNVPIPNWGLNDVGQRRVAAIATATSLALTTTVISSAEVKAIETAKPIAAAMGLGICIVPAMHENDRSSTGYLASDAFEQMADAFFANPDKSIKGWEPARSAQTRIVNEVHKTLRKAPKGDVLIVGHGGVGTLLYCALASCDISRNHDQGPGGGGQWFSFDRTHLTPDGPWRPMETLAD